MTFRRALPVTFLLSTFTLGCANDAGNGALIGGGVGALAGGIIGHQSGHTGVGMLIGGLAGAGTGALIGHASDENKLDKQREYERGQQDAARNARSSNDSYYNQPQPRAGYTQYSETSRTSVGRGGYQRSNETTVSTGEYYGR